MKKITKAMLEAKYACPLQVKKFVRLFPHGTYVTVKDVLLAQKQDLSLTWAANVLFTPRQQTYWYTERSRIFACATYDAAFYKAMAELFSKAWALGQKKKTVKKVGKKK